MKRSQERCAARSCKRRRRPAFNRSMDCPVRGDAFVACRSSHVVMGLAKYVSWALLVNLRPVGAEDFGAQTRGDWATLSFRCRSLSNDDLSGPGGTGARQSGKQPGFCLWRSPPNHRLSRVAAHLVHSGAVRVQQRRQARKRSLISDTTPSPPHGRP